MNSRKLTYLVWIFIVLHCAALIVYAWPVRSTFGSLRTYVSAYIEPVFRQHWSMFAPEPPTYHIEWGYRPAGGDWVYPGKSRLADYQSNRLSPRGKIYQMTQHIGFWLVRDHEDFIQNGMPSPYPENRNAKDISESFGYRAARHYATQLLADSIEKPTSVDIQVVRYYPETSTSRVNRDTLKFPSFRID